MRELPLEVLESVLEKVYYDARCNPDLSTLLACSLVCKSWVELSHRLLLHSVDLRSTEGARHFFRSIDPSTVAGGHLGAFVRTLHISTGSSNATTSIVPISLFIDILSSCPRLYELVLHAHDIHGFDPEDLAKLQRHDLSPIRALHLARCSVESRVESRVLYQLLDIWPTVEFLRITFGLNADPPAHATRVKLYELSLGRRLSVKILTWLLSSSELSLQILDLRDHFGNGLVRVLAKHGPHIRSLRTLSPTSEVQSLVENCPNLEELIIMEVIIVREPTGRLANILSSASQSLEHFGVWLGTPNNYFCELIDAVDHLQRLRVLSCFASDGRLEKHSRYSEIRSKCEEKKIDLRLLKIVTWKRMEDPVPVALFPRGISISHFRFMN